MSAINFNNGTLIVNGTDLSAQVKSITINYASEILDATAMGNAGRARIGGLKDWDLSVVFNQSSGVDATLFPIVGTSACWETRQVNACASGNNPIYSGIGIIEKYTPLSGVVGTLLPAPISVKGSNGVALSRASSS